MPKGVLFASESDQDVGCDVRMFCDPAEYPTKGSMFDSIECHAATAIVFESDDAIDVWKSFQEFFIEVPCHRARYAGRAIDGRDDGDVVTSSYSSRWALVAFEGLPCNGLGELAFRSRDLRSRGYGGT